MIRKLMQSPGGRTDLIFGVSIFIFAIVTMMGVFLYSPRDAMAIVITIFVYIWTVVGVLLIRYMAEGVVKITYRESDGANDDD